MLLEVLAASAQLPPLHVSPYEPIPFLLPPDTIYVKSDVFLKKDLSAELNIVAAHIDHNEQGHAHELWAHYLNQPHPSVATIRKYFQQAALEFKVPVDLLMAIGQVENNWTQIGPSIDKGWGIMHLVQNNYCNTLSEAAQLLGVSEQTLKDDARQNIRGAAALLRKYFGNSKNTKARIEDWYPAAAKFSGLIRRQLCQIEADRYYTVLSDGANSITLWNEQITLPRKKIDWQYIRSTFHDNTTEEEDNSRTADYGPAVGSFTTCNYSTGRNHSIDTWVNHWIGTGTAAGAVSWFQNCSANASAHFVTANNGTIYQTVAVANTAWHCGASGYPYNNGRSIGEEHEATLANPGLWNSTAMLQASAQMACYFCNQYNIPINQNITSPGICGHNNMPGTNTSCPGTIPWSTWFGYFNSGNCNASPPVQPSNDYCGNPPSLTVYGTTCGGTVTGDVNGATQSAAPTNCDGYTSSVANDVWYKFTATATSHNITVVPTSGMDAVVDLRSGCPGTSIDCQDAGGGEGATEILQATGLTVGTTYYVRVYDYTGAGNPPTTTTFTICVTTPCSQPTKPVIAGNNVFCSGQNSQLSVSNPCSGCTYVWSNGATGTQTTVTASGTYRVTATNNCGSLSSDPYGVTVNATPQPVIGNLSNAYCLASSNATLTATPIGGTFSGNGISGNVFSPSAAGVGTHVVTYTVTQNNCTGTASQSVTVSASPVVQISASGTTAFCSGGSVTLTATQGSAYNWSNGDTASSIQVTQSGTFHVTVTNPGGCNANVASTTPIDITVYPNPIASAGADQIFLQAQGNSLTLGGSPTAMGGTAPYNYQWSPATALNSDAMANPVVSNLTSSTTYTVTVTDANGCTATDDVAVDVVPYCTYTAQPAYFSFSANAAVDSFYVTTSDSTCTAWNVSICNWLSVVSPTLPYSGSGWLKFLVNANFDAQPRTCIVQLTGGQNIVIVQGGLVPDPCNPPLSPPQVHVNFCDLAADLIPNVTYQWYNGSMIVPGANTRFHTADQSGFYYVVIADSNFCSAQSQDVYVSYPLCLGTGINEWNEEDVLIYPNPLSDNLLTVSTGNLPLPVHISVFDATGRLLQTETITTSVAFLNTEKFSAGVYWLKIENNHLPTIGRRLVKY